MMKSNNYNQQILPKLPNSKTQIFFKTLLIYKQTKDKKKIEPVKTMKKQTNKSTNA